MNTKLDTPIYFMAVAPHALTGGQKIKGQGHTVTRTVTVAMMLPATVKCMCCCGRVLLLLLPVWDCTSYDCSCFLFEQRRRFCGTLCIDRGRFVVSAHR